MSKRHACAAIILAATLSPVEVLAIDPPQHLWSRAFTAAPIDSYSTRLRIRNVAAAPSGSAFVVGEVHGSVDVGGGPLASGFGEDPFVAKFDESGAHVWSRIFNLDTFGLASVAIDRAGNAVMVGGFAGTIDLGGATLSSTFGDAFVVKYDPAGGLLWARRFGAVPSPLGNHGSDVVVRPSGDIVMIGSFSGRMDFGGGASLQPSNGVDAFLLQLDATGEHMWSRRFGGRDSQEGKRLALDEDGNVIVAGEFSESINIDGVVLIGEGSDDIFLAGLDPDGSHVWSRQLNVEGTNGSPLEALVAGEAGNVALQFSFQDSIDLGGEVINGGGRVVARYDPAGEYRWKVYPLAFIEDICFDDGESLIVGGWFSNRLDLVDRTLRSIGAIDGYVVRFDLDGGVEWAMQLSGNEYVDVDALAVDPEQGFWLAGGFSDGIRFGDVRHEGTGEFLTRFGHRPPEPVLVVSLLLHNTSIEIHWNASGEVVLDRFSLLRYHASQPAPITVASGPIGSGDGIYVDQGVRAGERYQYELVVTMADGTEFRSALVTATVPTFVNQLSQNAPNPFNPTTSISYSVSATSYVVIEIYDVAGVHVRNLVEGTRDAGEYVADWDGRDDAGRAVGSGVYFYRLDGVSGVAPRKMVLLR